MSLTTNISTPKRGEVWLVNFDPTVGAEIRKVRPAVVISSDTIGRLPIKLIAPITDWKLYFVNNIWHVKIELDSSNGLAKTSAVDALQLRGIDKQRFIRKLGKLSVTTMEEITIAIAAVIEYVEAPEQR
ncbi:PemK family transcriptional regulator [Chlorogloea sp. CCALA 695]|nr:PemK family transcriptional regulator [Chlorogloea sp. CCALA 695]